MRLENWCIVFFKLDSNGLPIAKLAGNVYGHPDWPEDRYIKTARITRAEGQLIYTASGSQYELGKTSEQYEAVFPNARQQLFAALAANK